MAERRRTEARLARQNNRRKDDSTKVWDYRHEEAKRKNNMEVALFNWEPRPKTPPGVKYEYDPFLDPRLLGRVLPGHCGGR